MVAALRLRSLRRLLVVVLIGLLTVLAGCTTLEEYVHNGFKLGPNFGRPPAPIAEDWIDSADVRVSKREPDLSAWWKVFNDPVLDRLVCDAARQNLSLREAGFRILQARARLGITVGNLFPQRQVINGDYYRYGLSEEVANRIGIQERFYSQWDLGFGLAWELDFWGRYRRAIEAADDDLDASVEEYDAVLVTLLGDVASNYVLIRTLEEQIVLVQQNIETQKRVLKINEAQYKSGRRGELPVEQSLSTLKATEALVPEFERQLREATNRLCVLLGIPPEELRTKLGPAPIPLPPPEVVVGIPADLLRRRPDVRRAERQAAAACARIGIAESALYPAVSIVGTFGFSAEDFHDLFNAKAFRQQVGPSFTWNVLNYGRLLNNVKLHEARFQELATSYQNTVLKGNEEVENGLVTFLRTQQKARLLGEAVEATTRSLKIAEVNFDEGRIPFVWVAYLLEKLVEQQIEQTRARGDVALGLIQVYRALGGGWQIRLTDCAAEEKPVGPVMPVAPPPPFQLPETLPAPKPNPSEVKSGDKTALMPVSATDDATEFASERIAPKRPAAKPAGERPRPVEEPKPERLKPIPQSPSAALPAEEVEWTTTVEFGGGKCRR